MLEQTPILIAGPTASGKSGLALELARHFGGVIVNADSQQIYREWRVLSARPSVEEMAAAPHKLYGHVNIAEAYSVGHWVREVEGVLSDARIARQVPIIVGGTGLYFKALTEGLAPIPQVPLEIRETGEAAMERDGLRAFANALAVRDPQTAAVLDLDNPRRVLRAWEVLEATGVGLAGWKARTPAPLMPLKACQAFALTPNRDDLYSRCEARFDAMMADGALGEVEAVDMLGIAPEMPGLKAVGATPLRAYLAGEVSLEVAVARAKIDTRQYAKRQLTWVRNQMSAWTHVTDTETNRIVEIIQSQSADH